MRVAVVGASGNAGTALLRRLSGDTIITSVVGVARRVPSGEVPPPYDVAQWVRCDIGRPGEDAPVLDRLVEAFAGVDAVIHLAWLIQPNHDRAALRRTNVDGTRRVIEAVRRAGVPHLVVASSVGAYSPATDDLPRDEAWPTEGIRSSEYSVDKAAVERLLDEAEVLQPDLVVSRVRPSLIFQKHAGAEIQRYFLGRLFPARMLGEELPTLPWPAGLRLQAVHADDVASAYREIVARRRGGAFNLAGDGIVHGQDVADMLAGGRLQEVAPSAVRAAVAAAWHARLVPVSPGWLDLAMQVPVLSTARARHALGWAPTIPGARALREIVDGIAVGGGGGSPPLRPRAR
ncbi:NAD-dependent epimerase/dehydratase family protein [uncultured Cellulomonas sp.]|uniref:NAD-dependent epimerase/dehydratase family protein n=1 Tax=uncultured Cellulomonas sp. TaxID=189682 RepID=UPI002628435D|nr:NAD-dependent epimerase/dehydratase family protein [uncultured Cellulomonas sp.]